MLAHWLIQLINPTHCAPLERVNFSGILLQTYRSSGAKD